MSSCLMRRALPHLHQHDVRLGGEPPVEALREPAVPAGDDRRHHPVPARHVGLGEVGAARVRIVHVHVGEDAVVRLHEVGVGEEARVEERDRDPACRALCRAPRAAPAWAGSARRRGRSLPRGRVRSRASPRSPPRTRRTAPACGRHHGLLARTSSSPSGVSRSARAAPPVPVSAPQNGHSRASIIGIRHRQRAAERAGFTPVSGAGGLGGATQRPPEKRKGVAQGRSHRPALPGDPRLGTGLPPTPPHARRPATVGRVLATPPGR